MEKKWITVYKYFDVLEGQRLGEVLKAENILFKNISRHDSAFDGVFVATIGAGVIQVREDYIETARKIVSDFEKEQKKLLREAKKESSSSKPSLINVKAIFENKYLRISVASTLFICLLAAGVRVGRVYYFKYHPDLEKAKYYSEQGKILLDQGNYKQAIRQLKKSAIFDPNLAVSYARLGDAYLQLRQNKEAVKYYEKAINMEPNDHRYYGGLGNAYLGMGYYQNAIVALQKSIELNPKVEFAYIDLGKAYKSTGNWELSIVNYKKALELNPNNTAAYEGLSRVNYFLKDYNKMLEYAKKAIDINPNGATDGYFNAGLAYFGQKLYKEALPYFEKAVALDPKYALSHYYLGVVYKELGNEKLMKQQYNKLVELNRLDLADRLIGRYTREPATDVPFRF